MKNGMKQTEIGEIPAEWEVTKLSNKCRIKRGASPRPIKDPLWWGGTVGWVRISDVTSATKYLNKTTEYLSEAGVSKSVRIPRGEVILTICATIGVPIIINTDACIHDGFVWFDGLDSEIHREFFYYFLSSKREILAASRQLGTQGNLNTTIVGELVLALPPLPEQRKIAEILSTLDEKMAVIDEQLAQTQELKKGLMQRLLTKGIGHTQFKDSPLGEIPAGWKYVALSEVVDLLHGYQFRTHDFTNQGTPVIKIGNVDGGNLKLDNTGFIDTSRLADFSRFEIKNGDVLMSLTGNIGRVVEVKNLPMRVVQNYRVGKFEPVSMDIMSKLYMKHLLSSDLVLGQLFKMANQSAQANFGKQDMDKIWVPLPDTITEQRQIAEILTTVDDKIGVLQDKKAQYQTLKKGLMQQLLTGQRRVRVAAGPVAELV